ncbi:MAG: hypothetical protein U9O65_10160 [Thermotogota bacterium]|nr:hypothetical protein [Thermotogota bacterium]
MENKETEITIRLLEKEYRIYEELKQLFWHPTCDLDDLLKEKLLEYIDHLSREVCFHRTTIYDYALINNNQEKIQNIEFIKNMKSESFFCKIKFLNRKNILCKIPENLGENLVDGLRSLEEYYEEEASKEEYDPIWVQDEHENWVEYDDMAEFMRSEEYRIDIEKEIDEAVEEIRDFVVENTEIEGLIEGKGLSKIKENDENADDSDV